jgi:hypothetical protein
MAKKPKPPLKLVSESSTATWAEPPRNLGNHGRSLWDRIMSEYELKTVT